MTLEPPLITARCRRCFLVAGKYWVKDGEGFWFGSQRMHRGRVCRCDPAPVLPDGEQLAGFIARARRAGNTSSYATAPLVIHV
jgi:hypothetical protein